MVTKKEIINRAYQYIQYEDSALFKKEIEELIKADNQEELYERFYKDLEFGTGGLRGIIGGGYNRMNPFTVKRATQGFANYITKSVGKDNGSVVIAYDSRRFSNVFAEESAKVLCANGIKCYLFSSLRPTPELSFAVRKLHATAGIVITASHNPPEYNGYKVYWNDGAQVVSPTDKEIIEEVRKSSLKPLSMEKDSAISKGLLKVIDKEVDDDFVEMVKNCILRKGIFKNIPTDFKIVYTPLHGSGAMPVIRTLTESGINVITVPEQKEPDGNFPTVKYPNPEETSALKLAIELATKENAQLVIATDPDADRLGIAIKEEKEYKLITGNQLGALLEEYILSSRKELGIMPENPVIIKTIVTTELQREIANYYGVACIDTLTGFKYIGEKIREFEQNKNYSYVFGGEESYGYLVNTEVRDKDAVSAALLTVEMALFNYLQKRTLYDKLKDIWRNFGYFEETQISKKFEGESGFKDMKGLMEKLRTMPPLNFSEFKVVKLKDYQNGSTKILPEGVIEKNIFLPSSDVLQFILEDETIISVRPSGTEPKIKFYISSKSKEKTLEKAVSEVKRKIEIFKEEINKIIKGV